MPTKTTVLNDCLGLLGQTLVDSDTDDTENTRILNAHWGSVVELAHEKTAWDFAKLRAKLPRSDTVPAFGYQFYYTLPGDLLRILWLSPTGNKGDDLLNYEGEPGKIATDVEAVYLLYVSETSRDAVGRWSESFAHYVACELASRAMSKINPAAAEGVLRERKKAQSDAIGLDATQGPIQRRRLGTWARSARGSRFSREQQ